MSYLKFKFFFSSDEDGTFWPGVVELPVEKEITIDDPSNDENKNVLKCLNKNWISSKGEFIKKFEDSFKKKFNYKFATVTTNGTTALHLALLSLNVKKGDEVIVPNLTYPKFDW